MILCLADYNFQENRLFGYQASTDTRFQNTFYEYEKYQNPLHLSSVLTAV